MLAALQADPRSACSLVALGLLGAGIATRHYLDSFLVDRVDQQFGSAQVPALGYFAAGDSDPGAASQPGELAAVRVVRRPGHAGGRSPSSRSLRRHRQASDSPTAAPSAPHVGISTTDDYRVPSVDAASVAAPGPLAAGSATLVIAIPLDDVEQRPCTG